ncbi:MAG: hypothetical protein AAB966_03435 [Patescibacteria group bacterium]
MTDGSKEIPVPSNVIPIRKPDPDKKERDETRRKWHPARGPQTPPPEPQPPKDAA